MSQYANPPRATIDFESRSEISLRAHGSWRYSLDPTTEILCLAFRLPYWERGRTGLWHPAFPHLGIEESRDTSDLAELFRWIIKKKLVEAHNAWFERGIWTNQFPDWPRIHPSQWRCSAAKAAAHALPRGLEDAIDAMRIPDIQKDIEGQKIMKTLVKPRKAVKADWEAWGRKHAPCKWCDAGGRIATVKKDGSPTVKGDMCPMCGGLGLDPRKKLPQMPTLYLESKELFERLWRYNRQDVLAEERLSEELPDLSPAEQRVYELDQSMNERGFQLDRKAVEAALELVDIECADLNAELRILTDGVVERATQRDRMKVWLETQKLRLEDTTADTLDEILENGASTWQGTPTPQALRGLELMRTLGRSSTKKYQAMADWMCADGRVRGSILYHGATTGRWTGSGVQPHNFPKAALYVEKKPVSQDVLWPMLVTRNVPAIRARYGNIMEALSHGLRGTITATPGKVLYVADYAAIEARVVLWLAEDDEALDVFRRGEDIYCYMAESIYGYPCNKSDNPSERGVGKIAVLGLGYQMGPSKFVETCAAGGVTIIEDHECAVEDCGVVSRKHRKLRHEFVPPSDEITAVQVVDAYRAKFWRVKEMWRDQEETAIIAVENEDEEFTAGRIQWMVEDGFLYCTLPSGRRLAYPDPEVRTQTTSWGAIRPQLTFMGVNPLNHQWQRQSTYGGSLVENITQAVARDVMAEAFVRCEDSGIYVPVLSVHDEIIAEGEEGRDVHEFEQLVAQCPEWASGLPVAAEGWTGFRYHK